jgi:hypothetical protein
MYKIIMHLATINSVTTTQTLCDNLQTLGVYEATVSGNIDKVHNKFEKNYVDDPTGILFKAYLVVTCHNFKSYTHRQHKDYLNGKLTTITHEALMTSAKRKFDWLKTKGLRGAKSPDNKKIVAMTATLTAIKGHFKLDPKLSTIADEGKKKGDNKNKKRRTRRIHLTDVNRKGMRLGRKSRQRMVRNMRSRLANILTTGDHIAWTIHKSTNCFLGKQHKEDQKKNPQKANSATFATAAAMAVNPQFAALIAMIANLEE